MKSLLLMGLVVLVLLIAGCTGASPTYSDNRDTASGSQSNNQQQAAEPTTVTTLDLITAVGENWDADSDIDGLEVTIAPRDASDRIVKTDGIIKAKLWIAKNNNPKGTLIQEWSNVQLSKENIGVILGGDIRLEYSQDFKPQSTDKGYLEVILTTPDGEMFSAVDDYVQIPKLSDAQVLARYEDQYLASAKQIGQIITKGNFEVTLVSVGYFTHLSSGTYGDEVTDYRADIKVKNKGAGRDSYYLYNSALTIGGTQYDYSSFKSEFEGIDIQPNVTKEGYVVYENVPEGLSGEATLIVGEVSISYYDYPVKFTVQI